MSDHHPTRPTYVVTITDEPGHDVPLDCRLRRFLKHALRQYGLRVTSIVTGKPTQTRVMVDADDAPHDDASADDCPTLDTTEAPFVSARPAELVRVDHRKLVRVPPTLPPRRRPPAPP